MSEKKHITVDSYMETKVSFTEKSESPTLALSVTSEAAELATEANHSQSRGTTQEEEEYISPISFGLLYLGYLC